MKKHILFGQMVESDFNKLNARDECVSVIGLFRNNELIQGTSKLLKELETSQLFPTEIGVDLWLLALMIFAADTRVNRKSESEDSWTRELTVILPVSDVKRWNEAKPLLIDLLSFLTGDRWSFEFYERPNQYKTLVKNVSGNLFQEYQVVSLFSGGLDSLIGAIDYLSLCKEKGKVIFVSHHADRYTSDAQNKLSESIKNHYEALTPRFIRTYVRFDDKWVKDCNSEKSTRGRSFLFFALGALVGSGFQKPFQLRVPENGLIALNVPLDYLRLGSNSTRTTHPYYIDRWNKLLSILGIKGTVLNPYWNKTKGEMVKGCMNQGLLRQLVNLSISCSSPNKNSMMGSYAKHCGYCLPCLIRRAAINFAWGVGSDPTTYAIADLQQRVLDSSLAEGVQVRSFQYAIDQLHRNPSLAKFWIHKPGRLHNLGYNLSEIEDVYIRGMKEVGNLLVDVKTKAK